MPLIHYLFHLIIINLILCNDYKLQIIYVLVILIMIIQSSDSVFPLFKIWLIFILHQIIILLMIFHLINDDFDDYFFTLIF